MAYSNGATPITPPPPPIGFNGGGNRSTKHVVGRASSNFGTLSGANLNAARTNYQAGNSGGTYQHTPPPNRPQFDYKSAGATAAPTPAQQDGMELQGTSLGMTRPLNAPVGMGYTYGTGEPARQHHGPAGNPYVGTNNLNYTAPTYHGATVSPTATTAPATPIYPYPVPGTSWVEPPAPTTGPAAQDPPGTPPPKTVFQHAQEVRTKVTAGGGLKVGKYLPGENGQGVQAVTGLKKYGNTYLPLVGTGKNQQVHWAYRMLM